jgi:uncharacterized protein with von Willebrand factor type A (vWA) domain
MAGREIKPVLHDNSLELSHYDINFFNDVVEGVPVVGQNMHEGLKHVTTFRNLSEDIFLDLFKYNPKIRDKSSMNASRHFNHDLMGQLREHPAYQGLQSVCKLDEFNAALGSSSLQQVAIQKIQEFVEQEKQRQEQQRQNGGQPDPGMMDLINQLADQEQRDDYGGHIPQPGNGNPDPNAQPGNGPGLINDISDQGGQGAEDHGDTSYMTDDAAKKLAEIQRQRDYNRMMSQLADDIGNAATDVTKDLQEMSDFCQAWGLDSDSTKSRISFDSKKEAVERIRRSEKLKELTKVLGRFKAIARNKLKERSVGTGSTIHSVEVGGRIDKILPAELATRGNEATKKQFYKKLHERQLLQYQTTNDKRKGMGPIIVCEDVSGSMDGNRTMWARAVSLSLLEIAQRQNRDFTIILFDDKIVAEFEVLKKELDPNKLVDIAEIGSGGGTNFHKPTNRAMKIVQGAKKFRKADIVFITDGDCSLTGDEERELISMKRRLNVKIQTILIGGGRHEKKTVKAWADSIQPIGDLSDMNSEVAENIFVNTISDTGSTNPYGADLEDDDNV